MEQGIEQMFDTLWVAVDYGYANKQELLSTPTLTAFLEDERMVEILDSLD